MTTEESDGELQSGLWWMLGDVSCAVYKAQGARRSNVGIFKALYFYVIPYIYAVIRYNSKMPWSYSVQDIECRKEFQKWWMGLLKQAEDNAMKDSSQKSLFDLVLIFCYSS